MNVFYENKKVFFNIPTLSDYFTLISYLLTKPQIIPANFVNILFTILKFIWFDLFVFISLGVYGVWLKSFPLAIFPPRPSSLAYFCGSSSIKTAFSSSFVICLALNLVCCGSWVMQIIARLEVTTNQMQMEMFNISNSSWFSRNICHILLQPLG